MVLPYYLFIPDQHVHNCVDQSGWDLLAKQSNIYKDTHKLREQTSKDKLRSVCYKDMVCSSHGWYSEGAQLWHRVEDGKHLYGHHDDSNRSDSSGTGVPADHILIRLKYKHTSALLLLSDT